MEHLTLHTETDTATPRPVIPIFFIHSVETPFCNRAVCWCHANRASLAPFFAAINNGKLAVQKAASFEQGEGDTHEPKNG